jgi:hypothetical protein
LLWGIEWQVYSYKQSGHGEVPQPDDLTFAGFGEERCGATTRVLGTRWNIFGMREFTSGASGAS